MYPNIAQTILFHFKTYYGAIRHIVWIIFAPECTHPPILQNQYTKHIYVRKISTSYQNMSPSKIFSTFLMNWILIKQKNLTYWVQTSKYDGWSSKIGVISLHFHFSTQAFFRQKKYLLEILPIHCIQTLRRQFYFTLKHTKMQ